MTTDELATESGYAWHPEDNAVSWDSESTAPKPPSDETLTQNTRAMWELPTLEDEDFLIVAHEAIRIFVEEVVLIENPSMARKAQLRYIDNIPDVTLQDGDYTFPLSINNDLQIGFDVRYIEMFPHDGRGEARDDELIAKAIASFEEYLISREIESVRSLSIEDPNKRYR